MPLVPAKCPQCGANIEIDDSKDAGICKYCGTAFITEKAINNYNTYVTNNNNFAGANINVMAGNIDNLIKMAENAESAGNAKEANEYYSRALELDPSNKKALIGKGVTACESSTVTSINSNELLSYASKALQNCDDNTWVLDVLRKLYNTSLSVHKGISAYYSEQWKHLDAFNNLIQGLDVCIEITLYIQRVIESRKLENDAEFKKCYAASIKGCILCCVEACEQRKYVDSITSNAYFSTENKAGVKVSAEKHSRYLLIYNEMCEEIKKIDPSYEIPEINTEKECTGCYVATCVYGSYDCPEVWTLRRFRDDTLDATWYGRLFIKCYYAISPTIVKWFGDTRWFKSFWKKRLDKMVQNLNAKGVKNTQYNDKY